MPHFCVLCHPLTRFLFSPDPKLTSGPSESSQHSNLIDSPSDEEEEEGSQAGEGEGEGETESSTDNSTRHTGTHDNAGTTRAFGGAKVEETKGQGRRVESACASAPTRKGADARLC